MNKVKKISGYLLSFLIPIAILIMWLYTNNALSLKNNMIVVSDMYHQYMILLGQLKNLFSDGFIFYSFSKALGGNMIGTVVYYLLSPINVITLFFNQSNMQYACVLIILIKIGLCGTTMFLFLKNTFKQLTLPVLLMFSTCYALMMFNVVYFFNIIWLDGIILAPLVLWGIDRIIDGKKPILYSIGLFLTILINYYIGYIMCLFAVIYFLYKLLIKYKWNKDKQIIKKLITNFLLTSILSGLLAMIILIPMYIELKDSMRVVGNVFSTPLEINWDLIKLFSEFFVGISRKKVLLNPDSFLLYTGIITFILSIFYFFNNKINKREKILSLIVLFIFISSFMCNYLNYIWQGMTITNCFNGRYTFLFSFYLIYLSVKCFINLDGVKKIVYFAIAPLYPIVGLFAYIKGLIDLPYVYVSVGLFFLYLFIVYQINHNDNVYKKQLIMMLVVVAISELFFNAYADLSHYSLLKENMIEGKYRDYSDIYNNIKNNDSSLFYRTYLVKEATANDPFYFNYNGTEVFLSSVNKKLFGFYKNNGCHTRGNTVLSYTCHNYMLDALLDVKYLGFPDKQDDAYKLTYQKSIREGSNLFYGFANITMNVQENPYALSLGFMVNKDILDFNKQYQSIKQDPITYQNLVYKLISDKHMDLIKKIDLTKVDYNVYRFTNISDSPYFVTANYDNKAITEKVEIYFNDNSLIDTVNAAKYSVYVKNTFNTNENVTIKIKMNNYTLVPKNVSLYYFDMEAFKEAINELKKEQMNILVNKESYLKTSIDVTSDKTVLLTTIPYEQGWQILVDNRQVKYYPVMDTFIGLDLTKGKHTIEFKFSPPGIKIGAIISGISLVLLVSYLLYFEKINKKIFKEKEDEAQKKLI